MAELELPLYDLAIKYISVTITKAPKDTIDVEVSAGRLLSVVGVVVVELDI